MPLPIILNQRKYDRKDQALDGGNQATQGHLAVGTADRRRGMPGQYVAHFFIDRRGAAEGLEGVTERVKHDSRVFNSEPILVAQVALKPLAEVGATPSVVIGDQLGEKPVMASLFDDCHVTKQ